MVASASWQKHKSTQSQQQWVLVFSRGFLLRDVPPSACVHPVHQGVVKEGLCAGHERGSVLTQHLRVLEPQEGENMSERGTTQVGTLSRAVLLQHLCESEQEASISNRGCCTAQMIVAQHLGWTVNARHITQAVICHTCNGRSMHVTLHRWSFAIHGTDGQCTTYYTGGHLPYMGQTYMFLNIGFVKKKFGDVQ
eukprot:1160146-Pelagomonas_calceolata.AAC.23